MCGLGAIIIKENKDKEKYKSKLLNMSNLISHRGPDQAGFLEYENILLSHLRLPVMDPRNLGRQPMSVDNRYSIIFNGEIFNYKEIKRTLIERKYKFYSNSDTEVALNAFIEWNENGPHNNLYGWIYHGSFNGLMVLLYQETQLACGIIRNMKH